MKHDELMRIGDTILGGHPLPIATIGDVLGTDLTWHA
jgi:hypothetical protein